MAQDCRLLVSATVVLTSLKKVGKTEKLPHQKKWKFDIPAQAMFVGLVLSHIWKDSNDFGFVGQLMICNQQKLQLCQSAEGFLNSAEDFPQNVVSWGSHT